MIPSRRRNPVFIACATLPSACASSSHRASSISSTWQRTPARASNRSSAAGALARCPDVFADSLDGRRALAALRSAAEAGVDLTYPSGERLAEDRGGDLLVAEHIARTHDHPISLPPSTHLLPGHAWSMDGARAQRCSAGHKRDFRIRDRWRLVRGL